MSFSNKVRLASFIPLFMLLIAVSASLYYLVKLDKQVTNELTEVYNRQAILLDILAELGYGRGIHSFKNYVIRGDEHYHATAAEAFSRAQEKIHHYLSLKKLTELERSAMETVRDVITKYQTQLPYVKEGMLAGTTTPVLDQMVKVDDSLAVDKLTQLELYLNKERTDSLNDFMDNRWRAGVTLSCLFLLCAMVAFSVSRKLSKQVTGALNYFSRLTKRIGRGEYEIDRSEVLNKQKDADLRALGLDLVNLGSSLGETLDNLQRSNEELERFAFVAAHDLQEPVKKISMLASLLERRLQKEGADTSAKQANNIREIAAYMKNVNHSLLGYARLNHSYITDMELVNLNGVVSDSLSTLESSIRDAEVKIEVATLPSVTGDRVLLTQLFQNLFSNAIKYRSDERKSEIEVLANYEGEQTWTIAVRDNGVGFEPSQASKILEPFGRAHSRSEYKGCGIGLATCNKILKAHHSEFEVTAEPGKGASFAFRLEQTRA